jgi:uncharacterized protein YbjT (DUF2867 family)
MKILVIGASKGTGALAVKEALSRGHEVTALARSPEKLTLDHPKLTKLKGDFHDRNSVAQAVKGHDAVIVTASVSKLKDFKNKPDYFSLGTGYVIDALKSHGIKRLVVLGALGTGDSRALQPWFVRKLLLDGILRHAFADHEREEALVRASGLHWTIARPGRLTDGPGRRQYRKTAALEAVPSSIARADVADFLVEAATTDSWWQKAVQLGG